MLGPTSVRPRARLLGAVAGLALLAAPAAAQQQASLTLTGTATGASYGGYYVGPLTGTAAAGLPGQAQAVTLFCVDFLHAARFGETYTANVSAVSAGALANTRQASVTNSLEGYRKAVWLADQFALQPQANWGGIQGAIWKLFGSGAFDGNPVKSGTTAVATNASNEVYWTSQASTFARSAQYATYDYGRYSIYTDASPVNGGRQEFIGRAVVPEPGTLSLVAVGVVAGAGWAVRRRRA